MKRREFIQTTAMASAATLLYSCSASMVETKSIGLQLYTLRNKIRKNDAGTAYFSKDEIISVLKSVADIGFSKLEAFDYKDGSIYNIPYQDFSAMVSDLGMQITSGHYATGQVEPEKIGTLINGWEQAVEDAKKIGQENMVVAYLEVKERDTIDQYKKVCELLNEANETCRQAGVKLQYHNHEFEFETMEGQIPYEVMLAELDPSISMELDLYWVTFAGKNPVDYFTRYPGRFEQWHVKDMSRNDRKLQADVGTGSIDFKSIFEKSELSGMKNFYLEQEDYPSSELESIAKGYKYLQTI